MLRKKTFLKVCNWVYNVHYTCFMTNFHEEKVWEWKVTTPFLEQFQLVVFHNSVAILAQSMSWAFFCY